MSGDVPIRNALFIDQSELKIEIDIERSENKFCCRKFITLTNISDQFCNETTVEFSILQNFSISRILFDFRASDWLMIENFLKDSLYRNENVQSSSKEYFENMNEIPNRDHFLTMKKILGCFAGTVVLIG